MDAALLKEHAKFKKRALGIPTVEKRKAKDDSNQPNKKSKPSKLKGLYPEH